MYLLPVQQKKTTAKNPKTQDMNKTHRSSNIKYHPPQEQILQNPSVITQFSAKSVR